MLTQEEVSESIKHRDAILNIRAVLATKSGQEFFKYLFEVFDITDLPEIGLEGQILFEKLGFLRAANAIFKLTAEADPVAATRFFAEAEKERYDKLYKNTQSAGQ